MQEYLEQLDLEWVLINASKELLTFVKRSSNVTYADAIKFARENSPETFEDSNTGLVRKTALEKLYDKYKQEAIGKSTTTKQAITTDQLIENRLNDLENILREYPDSEEYPEGLKKELGQLKLLSKGKNDEILNLERVTEDEALRKDIIAQRANKVFVTTHLGKYNIYKDKDDGTVFQIAVLHPNKKEKITGADLIYEQYDIERRKVRIAAIQYKIWDRQTLYFSQSGNIANQIKKLQYCFCQNKYCSDESGSNFSNKIFRLPFCAAFLRPTDKLQNPKNLFTSGYHLPICKIEQLKSQGHTKDLIREFQIKKSSLNAYSFEELFNAEMVGSRWLDITELEKFYKQSKVLEESQNLTIHAQDLSPESKRYLLEGY